MTTFLGAEALVRTLVDSGVRVVFANPGTSEMQFVAALPDVPDMRGVLCLFEGVATGAADGYGRMTGSPAATLLHLGPGLANGLANLHNARRAHTPVVNVVGDHATHHAHLDAPLQSDIGAVAGSVSSWVGRVTSVGDISDMTARAIASTRGGGGDVDAAGATGTSGRVATLIVPADVSWSRGAEVAPDVAHREPTPVPEARLDEVAAIVRSGSPVVLLLGGDALSEDGLRAASRIEQAAGVRILAETNPARLRRGAGVPAIERLAYRGERARLQLEGASTIVLIGAGVPVTAFAYPGQSGELIPAGADTLSLVPEGSSDAVDALDRLADRLAPDASPVLVAHATPPLPVDGPLTTTAWAQVIGSLLPDQAVVCDESITSGMTTLPAATASSPAHDLLSLTGLAIGQGLPLGIGAAIACPDRPVLVLEADGSAMYTLSALWTHAREHLDITTVILNNRSYAILRAELDRVGAVADGVAADLLDIDRPDLDFVSLAAGMGVPATRATTVHELADQFAAALAEPGPHLIEAVISE